MGGRKVDNKTLRSILTGEAPQIRMNLFFFIVVEELKDSQIILPLAICWSQDHETYQDPLYIRHKMAWGQTQMGQQFPY